MDPLVLELLRQTPAVVIGLAVVIAAAKGVVRFAPEVAAWRGRAERAENQVDRLVPLVEKLSDKIDALHEVRR